MKVATSAERSTRAAEEKDHRGGYSMDVKTCISSGVRKRTCDYLILGQCPERFSGRGALKRALVDSHRSS